MIRSSTRLSTPLLDVQLYRPGPALALTLLMLPVVVALAGAVIALDTVNTIPLWLPLIALLWVPLLPLLWVIMQSARTTSQGIAVGRLWRKWIEIQWSQVERANRVGPFLTIVSQSGQKLTIIPALLRDGARLERALILRLPASVLTGRLSRDAGNLIAPGVMFSPSNGFDGTLSITPARRWRVSVSVVVLAFTCALVLSIATFSQQMAALRIVLIVMLASMDVAAVALLGWLLHSLNLDAEGLSMNIPLFRRRSVMKWSDVHIVEYSPHWVVVRFRGSRKVRSVGPGLLSPAQHTLMSAYIHEYCLNRGIPAVKRSWMFF